MQKDTRWLQVPKADDRNPQESFIIMVIRPGNTLGEVLPDG